MEQIKFQYLKLAVGEIVLASYDNKLCMCDWRYRKMRDRIDRRIENGLNAKLVEESSETIERTEQQINEYFNRERQVFDLPVLMVGTDFQKSVWNGLLEIPFGETSSYLTLAEKVANKNSVRAVANANGANAISIIIPCHRIIGNKGELVGHAGGLNTKEKLLRLENDLFK